MTEAMAAGNAIIARNVGQTDLFVKENYNGLLLSPDSVTGLKLALLDVMNNSDKLENMGNQSVKLVRDTHNFQNFINQLESFWNEISKS
jgi:glycosyltransferase involved in cell wall biosynthesis